MREPRLGFVPHTVSAVGRHKPARPGADKTTRPALVKNFRTAQQNLWTLPCRFQGPSASQGSALSLWGRFGTLLTLSYSLPAPPPRKDPPRTGGGRQKDHNFTKLTGAKRNWLGRSTPPPCAAREQISGNPESTDSMQAIGPPPRKWLEPADGPRPNPSWERPVHRSLPAPTRGSSPGLAECSRHGNRSLPVRKSASK